jgi:SmpA / OmlA family
MMKMLSYLAGRLPWLVLGIGVGAAAVWLARDRTAPRIPAPEPVAIAPAPRAVSVTDDPERARRIGAALASIKPGMTRREVEAILGPPDLERWQQFSSRWRSGPDGKQRYAELQYVIYYCSPPQLPPGRHLMTVEYESKPLEPIPPDAKVAEVSGPHTPDNCG